MPSQPSFSLPNISTDDVPVLLDRLYRIECAAVRVLPGERDRNFLVEQKTGTRNVLKIARADEDPEFLEVQSRLLQQIAARGCHLCPAVVAGAGDQSVTWWERDGDRYPVRLVSWIDGKPLGKLHHVSQELLESLGESVALVDLAMADFDHPSLHRSFPWNLQQSRPLLRRGLERIPDSGQREQVATLLDRFARHTAPWLEDLPCSAIHNDANENNVIVDPDETGRADRVAGLIDFGDIVHSWTVSGLSIAVAYAWLTTTDPLTTARAVTRGYCRHRPLSHAEATAVFGLASMRLCTSVVMALQQAQQQPDNEYLLISQQPIRRILPRLTEIPFAIGAATVRESAGLPVCRHGQRVQHWLERSGHRAVFPLSISPDFLPGADRPPRVLDLSVESPLLAGDPQRFAETPLNRPVDSGMKTVEGELTIGRYLEPRILYQSHQYQGAGPEDERRTIHLGIDLFAPAGTPVVAPLDARVKTVANLDRPLDYGGMVILQHTVPNGPPDWLTFFTLYGHLDPDSLADLKPGQLLKPGQQFARLGAADVNGGWTPHLHYQVLSDLCDLNQEFPGVCRFSQHAIWRVFSPNPGWLAGLPGSMAAHPGGYRRPVRRSPAFGRGLSLSYRQPLRLVRGWKQYLYDDSGRRYLDAFNNVPHVGHSHPQVVEAIERQLRLLNTNTRYLNDQSEALSGRICGTLPESLEVCYLLSSASEANELALRLARAYTGARDMIVMEGAYHGNTTGLVDISPYKFAGPGGFAQPDRVHVVPLPDVYRGAWRDPQTAGRQYADTVGRALQDMATSGRPCCGFIAESCPSVGGQYMLPADYLKTAYRLVRDAGGVCIADDVQTGYGRLGDVFFGFEDSGVLPDIVVLGKPIGNGYPLAAVITTAAIADAFDNGMEFFSTFGGNTVAAAAGLAVLDVLEQEGLPDHAQRIGQRLVGGLRQMQSEYPMAGDVRGRGFFLGVDLVRNPVDREPWPEAARYIVNRLRERNILIGTDGMHDNVLKIRPPMCFSGDDADRLLGDLEQVFAEWRARQ